MAATDVELRQSFVSATFLASLALVLAACAQSTPLERSALSQSVPAEQALAVPPPGGPAIQGVIERRYSNAVQHEIVLAADSAVPGQNVLRIQMFGPVGADGGTTALPNRQLAETDLAREMRTLLPGVSMQRSPLYAQNSYGPFGYAVGRHASGDLCLYGWQRIAASQVGTPFTSQGTIQVRLRLCQRNSNEQALLSVMYGFTINASFSGGGWNPFGPPRGVDPDLGGTGRAIYPSGIQGHETVIAPVSATPAPRAQRSTPRTAPEPPTPSQQPEPSEPAMPADAPIVPPPPTAGIQDAAPTVPPPPSR